MWCARGDGGKAGGQCPASWQLGRAGRSCWERAGASGAPNFPSGFLPHTTGSCLRAEMRPRNLPLSQIR